MAATNNKLYTMKTNLTDDDDYRIPKLQKPIYMNDLKPKRGADRNEEEELSKISDIFSTGVTKTNYKDFYHCLLWYEESIKEMNYKKTNNIVQDVQLHPKVIKWKQKKNRKCYVLYLSQNLLKKLTCSSGDSVLLESQDTSKRFKAQIFNIEGNGIFIHEFSPNINNYTGSMVFDVHFLMSRYLFDHMHDAVHKIFEKSQSTRIFPRRNNIPEILTLQWYFNNSIGSNREQRLAVEHIVAGSSGTAPYLLHGPPGTGKTVTIVEAILQLVEDESNRIMVCTESNMAADHVASALLKYADEFDDTNYFLLRSNAESRDWKIMPECLIKYSNGKNRDSHVAIKIGEVVKYSIVVCTTSHAATFAKQLEKRFGRHITHLFIDEAAQAMEPSTLVPICSVLNKNGSLVLAGDPFQLGPVLSSHNAKKIGLGLSLMERLMKTCPLYKSEDPNYTVMLKSNFRSDPDILAIPNKLFYKERLKMNAAKDKLSGTDILQLKPRSRAIVFHAVVSQEEREDKNPSYFNSMELEMVEIYVEHLVKNHKVKQEDIGVITPYSKQLSKIQDWLQKNYNKIEAGTVEAFQGKEKRVILISTVRGNGNHPGEIRKQKAQLGFLCDEKRFNVALTRAKAKAIVIGNPFCLKNEVNWGLYIQKCKEFDTYLEFDALNIKTIKTSVQKYPIDDATRKLERMNIREKPVRPQAVTREYLNNSKTEERPASRGQPVATLLDWDIIPERPIRRGPEAVTREYLNYSTQTWERENICERRTSGDQPVETMLDWEIFHGRPISRGPEIATKSRSSRGKCTII